MKTNKLHFCPACGKAQPDLRRRRSCFWCKVVSKRVNFDVNTGIPNQHHLDPYEDGIKTVYL